jgi:enoyl-CoA hydratase
VADARADVLSAAVEGRVRVLRLTRPGALNALNRDMLLALERELGGLERPGGAGALVITGEGDRAFCAGADLGELAGLSIEQARDTLALGQRVMRRLERLPIASIAAVNGLALGGGFELALSCSFIVAGASASFAAPETALGLIPGYGGTQRLARVAGLHVARRLVLTGERVSAARAWELGLCSEPPVEDGELVPRATRIAAAIAERGPLATRLAIEAMLLQAPDEGQLAHEHALAATAGASKQAADGIAAFREKRPVRFGGAT